MDWDFIIDGAWNGQRHLRRGLQKISRSDSIDRALVDRIHVWVMSGIAEQARLTYLTCVEELERRGAKFHAQKYERLIRFPKGGALRFISYKHTRPESLAGVEGEFHAWG